MSSGPTGLTPDQELANLLAEEERMVREGIKESNRAKLRRHSDIMALTVAREEAAGNLLPGFTPPAGSSMAPSPPPTPASTSSPAPAAPTPAAGGALSSPPRVITGPVTFGPPGGACTLTKLALDTDFDVCSDDVANFTDYKKFYILRDGGNYYHWLQTRTDPDDDIAIKPEPIPITWPSTRALKFTATFLVDPAMPFAAAPTMRVVDPTNNYTFTTQPGQTSGEFEVTFESTNKPFEGTVRYFSNFTLMFDSSEDGGASWVSAGGSRNRFYCTWKEPVWANFDDSIPDEGINVKVTATFNGGKKNILESLLYIGCIHAQGKGNTITPGATPAASLAANQVEILDAAFRPFQPKKLDRCREGTPYLDQDFSAVGLGYWRNASGLIPPAGSTFTRGLRDLLTNGDARCGEFCNFFQHIAYAQGIPLGSLWIVTAMGLNVPVPPAFPQLVNSIFLVKTWTINDPRAPVEDAGTSNKAQGNTNPMHFFWDHIFTVLQVGTTFRFYDPSYGIRGNNFEPNAMTLVNNYTNAALTGVVYASTVGGLESFVDHRHSGATLNIHDPGQPAVPFRYETITASMGEHLFIQVRPPGNGTAGAFIEPATLVRP